MVATFLHDEKPVSPDEFSSEKPPICAGCNEPMWLLRVDKTVSDKGIDGTYTFECKHCGSLQRVHSHTDRPGGIPIAPEL